MLRIVHDAPGPDANEAVGGPAPDLDELCRLAAREMLAIALEAERRAYLEAHADRLDAAGYRLVVGNGSARARAITTGAGRIEVAAPGSTTAGRASASARPSYRPVHAG